MMRTLGILILTAGAALAQPTPFPTDAQRAAEQAASTALQAQQAAQLAKARAALEASLAQANARRQQAGSQAKEIAALEAELAEARKQYAETHPKIVDLRRQLAQMQLARRRTELELQYNYSTGAQTAPFPKTSTGFPTGLPDRWWKNDGAARYVGLTATQQKQMDDVFQQSKPRLIDLTAALEKEEVALQPLVSADTLNESKIAAQIDRVAQARAELEKANGRMLLGIRKTLSAEQWNKLGQMPFVTEKR